MLFRWQIIRSILGLQNLGLHPKTFCPYPIRLNLNGGIVFQTIIICWMQMVKFSGKRCLALFIGIKKRVASEDGEKNAQKLNKEFFKSWNFLTPLWPKYFWFLMKHSECCVCVRFQSVFRPNFVLFSSQSYISG